jgi:hypothetical protein
MGQFVVKFPSVKRPSTNGRKWPGAVSQSSPKAMALMYRGAVIEFRQLDILLMAMQLTVVIFHPQPAKLP